MNHMKKIIPLRLLRRIIQIVSFILIPGLFTSIFYAMKEIYQSILLGTFSLESVAPQILLFLGSILITILIGRFFCGFFCSFGTMGDFLWFLSQKTIKPKWRIKESTDAWLKKIKYVILVFILIGIWTFHIGNRNSMASPWTIFGIYLRLTSWSTLTYLFSVGGFLLLLIIIGSLFVERFFCRYLCPLGAVFTLTSRFRLFRIIKNRKNCKSCKLCTHKCAMGIPLYQYDTVTSGECINCFECTINCPKQNAKANIKPVVASAVSTAALFGLVYVGDVAAAMQSDNSEQVSVVAQTNKGNYVDGTYTGSGNGFRGETKASVTVENGNITDITILSYDDDKEYFDKAKNKVLSEILMSQVTDVDAVSGATFSSNGIMKAVANALSISDTSTSDESVSEEQVSDSMPAVYKDGMYTGAGTGFRGDTEVSVQVENGKIADITIVSYVDDEKFFVRAKEPVIQEIMKKQDVNVDAVSGATYSSNGIMEAVANALGISYENTNSDRQREGNGRHGKRH